MKNIYKKLIPNTNARDIILFLFLGIIIPMISIFIDTCHAQVFEFRRIGAGSDTAEIYISCYWYDEGDTEYGGVFRSIDNGKTMSVKYKDIWPFGIVYGNIFGDSLSGTVYLFIGVNVSHDSGVSWENKPIPPISYFEGINGCLEGEIYFKGHISSGQIVLYRATHFGDSLYLMNTHMDSLSCIEAGSLPGEIYAILWPYYGLSSDTFGLAFSNNFGQTFSVTYLDTSIISNIEQRTLTHGPSPGELYMVALDFYNQYHIFHSFDYGQTFEVKHITPPIIYGWEDFSFVAGRKPGTFYMLKGYLCPDVPLHYCIEIHFSRDYGTTYTVYYHELDSTFTGVSKKHPKKKELLIYPNPANGKIALVTYESLINAKAEIYDHFGKPLYITVFHPNQKKIEIDVGGLIPGIYLLEVTNDERVLGVEKVVILEK